MCSRTWSFVCSSRSGRRPGALLSPAAGTAQLRKFPANRAVSQSCKAAAPKAAQSHRAKTSHAVPRRQISHTSCCCFAEICSRRQRKRVRSISEGVKVRGFGTIPRFVLCLATMSPLSMKPTLPIKKCTIYVNW